MWRYLGLVPALGFERCWYDCCWTVCAASLHTAFLSPVFHMWNEKGIEVHSFEEGSSMSQVVFSEHVLHFNCVFPKTMVL